MAQADSRPPVVRCPKCGYPGSQRSFWKVKCSNPQCGKFDAEQAARFNRNRIIGRNAADVFSHLTGAFSPGQSAIHIRYMNFRGDELIYTADIRTAYRTGEYLVVKVVPTGRRIALRLASIQNRSEVEANVPSTSGPNPDERRILNYHLRRGTTSALFEEVRAKYPEYRL